MSWWPITIYSLAALVALRTLFALMTQHRRRYLNQLIEAETARRETEGPSAESPSTQSDPRPKVAA